MPTLAAVLVTPFPDTWEAMAERGREALTALADLCRVPLDSGRYPAPANVPDGVTWLQEGQAVNHDPQAPDRLRIEGDVEAWLRAPLPLSRPAPAPEHGLPDRPASVGRRTGGGNGERPALPRGPVPHPTRHREPDSLARPRVESTHMII